MSKKWVFVAVTAVFLAHPAAAATRYDGDGVLSARLELERWYINRARFNPENESDRLALTNASNRAYDTCEGWAGETEWPFFGTTVSEWALWQTNMQPLAPNAVLNDCAENHCRDLAETAAWSHYSPSSNYYPLGSGPLQRQEYDGYTNEIIGYLENLAWGMYRSPSLPHPPYGRLPEAVHAGAYIDSSSGERGHRKGILNEYAREIGLGWARTNRYEYMASPAPAGWYYTTSDYDCQDFARRGSAHFFTGTVFYDANSNGFYEEGEGVGGIEVRLWDGAQEANWFDASQPSGNFAVPIEDLVDGNTITVQLINTNSTAKRLTIPIRYNAMGEFELAASESLNYATFTQPGAVRNVGFRNTDPLFWAGSTTVGDTNATVSFSGMIGAVYDIQSSETLAPPDWTNFAVVTAAQEIVQVIDAGQGGRTPPGSVPHRFYRIRLRRN